MKLLFLDIDGVMNDHRRWENKFAPIMQEHVVHLNTILAAVPTLKIVLSSAWRYRFETSYVIEALLCVHNVNAFERVHGATAFDPVPEQKEPYDNVEWWSAMGLRWRAQQIQDYVCNAPFQDPFNDIEDHVRYAVLDDLPLQVEHLFQTDPSVGLTAEIAEQVILHFQRPEADLFREPVPSNYFGYSEI